MKLTKAQRAVLARAANRDDGCVCPTPGLHGACQEAVLESLRTKSLIEFFGPFWRITDAGRAALEAQS